MIYTFIYAFWYLIIIAVTVILIAYVRKVRQNKKVKRFIEKHPDFVEFVEKNSLDPYKSMIKYKKSITYKSDKEQDENG